MLEKNSHYEGNGRFPFDQKFRKFRVWERMEQTFSGISFRNFGCTSRGWPKIPENRNNRKIPFHSTIPARAQFLRVRKSNSTWLPILLLNISVPFVIMRQMTWMFFCTTFAPEPRQTFVSSVKMHISYEQCLKLVRKIERYRALKVQSSRGLGLNSYAIRSYPHWTALCRRPRPILRSFQLHSRRATLKASKIDKESAIFLIPLFIWYFRAKIGTWWTGTAWFKPTGKYCSIRHMEYSKFHSGIFGRMESAQCLLFIWLLQFIATWLITQTTILTRSLQFGWYTCNNYYKCISRIVQNGLIFSFIWY